MIDFLYAKNKTYDFTGDKISFSTSSITYNYIALSGAKTYLEHLTNFLAWTSGGLISVKMDTEFIKITYNSGFILGITSTNIEFAKLFGLNSVNVTGISSLSYTFPTWGYKLPRTTVHALASLQGGFTDEKKVVELYRQRQTKVTKNMTYSAPYAVRRGFTYTYRLDYKHIDQFDIILAEWMDEVITSTTDYGIIEATCISDDSGVQTVVYPYQEIYEMTITLLR